MNSFTSLKTITVTPSGSVALRGKNNSNRVKSLCGISWDFNLTFASNPEEIKSTSFQAFSPSVDRMNLCELTSGT